MNKLLKEVIIEPGKLRDQMLMNIGSSIVIETLRSQNNPVFGFKMALAIAEGAHIKSKGIADYLIWRRVEAEGFNPSKQALTIGTFYNGIKEEVHLQIGEVDENTESA